MQNAKAAFFCLRGQVFFTTMTRFIFVNQKLHSKIEEHTGHDFRETFLTLMAFSAQQKNESSTPEPF